jgi:hypothetical protein
LEKEKIESPQIWQPPVARKWEPGVDVDRAVTVGEFPPWPENYPPLTSYKDNLAWRARIGRECRNDPLKVQSILKICRENMFFFWTGFCWLIEVRSGGERGSVFPFIPYAYQFDIGEKLSAAIDEQEDRAIAKSRDMGMTWIALLVILHKWRFVDGFTSLLASEKEKLVDQLGNWNTLFEKLRFNIRRLPFWMLPAGFDRKVHDKYMLLKNPETGGEIEGASTTGDIGRSGRYNVIMLDEHAAIHTNDQNRIEAATADAAASRWYISTPRGDQNLFFKKCHGGETKMHEVHWMLHPYKGYQAWQEIGIKDGKIIRGKIRSPWYDHEVAKRNQPPWMISQELDISFAGSIGGILDSHVMAEWRRSAPDPIDERYFKHRHDGEAALLIFEKPEKGIQYIVGGDPSGGTASGSNTAAQVFRLPGLQQIAEYQGRIGLDVFSTLLYALGREYNWAYLCVEGNMGTSVLVDLAEGHIDREGLIGPRDARVRPYPRKLIAKHCTPDGEKPTKEKLGIWTTEASKKFMAYSLLEPYVRNQDMLVRGRRTLSEMAGFRDEGSKIHNPDGDDLVMALNVLLYGFRFMPKQQTRPAPFLAG